MPFLSYEQFRGLLPFGKSSNLKTISRLSRIVRQKNEEIKKLKSLIRGLESSFLAEEHKNEQNLENSTNTKRSVDLQNDLDLANQHIRSLERQLAKLTEEKSE